MMNVLRSWGARLARGAVLAGLLAATAVQAAPMPNAARNVSITAREQPIAAFLQNLFAAVDVPADIGTNVGGTVNGTFVGPAEKVLRDIARVYNLVPYFDGAVMHVVPASELARRTYTVAPSLSERALQEIEQLGLTDARNTLRRSSDGSLLAVGTRRFVDQVEELLQARQAQQQPPQPQPSVGSDFRVFYLRYAWAQDVTMTLGGRQLVVPGVASILRSLVGAEATAPIGYEIALAPMLPSLKGQGLAGQGVRPEKPLSPEAARTAQVDALVAALARTAQPAEQKPTKTIAMPDAQPIRIEADPRLNAVIVRDLAERLPRYEQLIAALDVEPQSLEIEATIIDVNTDLARELGIDWRWSNDGRTAGYNGGVPTFGIGGVASVVLGSAGQFVARIRALQAEGAARIVSSPQVVTLSNVEAIFDNSSTFFVRVAGREQVDLFNVNAGTMLRVTPHVFRDRDATRIKLLVNVEDGTLTNREVDKIPVVERATINTQALIAEGESLLIGGMVRDATSSSVDKVPVLGDVPVVGNLFKNRINSSTRIERMFLITPRLASGRRAAPITTVQTAAAPSAVPAAPAGQPTPIAAKAPAAPTVPAVAQAPAPIAANAPAAVPAAAPAPIAASAPAAPVPAQAPAPAIRERRPSVELDLDAPLPAAPRTRSLPPPKQSQGAPNRADRATVASRTVALD
jgi:type III secretion protein C